MLRRSFGRAPWWFLLENFGAKPIKCVYPKFFPDACVSRSPLMLLAHINNPNRGAHIYGIQSIPDPPDHSTFNWGGSIIDDNIVGKYCTDNECVLEIDNESANGCH
jgi:hypothetical protein